MSLTSIRNMADSDFDSFLEMLHKDYPELVLKYNITINDKIDFIEGVVRQVWIQKKFDIEEILKFIVRRRS